MFSKLKKRIEEEVGDLGQLASPLTNPFGGGDKRVGGSTQGTNTPNNLGSRQSSLASLVDLHGHDEPLSPLSPNSNNPMLTVPSPSTRSASSNTSSRQKVQELIDAEVKKVNAEWSKKMDSLKKSCEERIQNQEADFAWKYSSKDEELERLRSEKLKTEELIKTMEGSYHNKISRVQDDMDQLEGYTKQEMAKVKHLLLNTQADLQKAQAELVENQATSKVLAEENRNLKSENETLRRNLDRDKLNQVFETDHLERELAKRDTAIHELRHTDDAKDKEVLRLESELANLRSEANLERKLKIGLEDMIRELKSENEAILNRDKLNQNKTEVEHEEILGKISDLEKQRNETFAALKLSCDKATEELERVQSDLVKSQAQSSSQKMQHEVDLVENVGKIQALEHDLKNRDSAIIELKSAIELEIKKTAEAVSNIALMKVTIEEHLKDKETLNEHIHSIKSDNEKLLQSLEEERLTQDKLLKANDSSASKICELEKQLEKSDSWAAQLKASLSTTKTELLDVQSSLANLTSKATHGEDEVKILLKEAAELRLSNKSILQDLESSRVKGKSLEVELSDKTSRISDLQLQLTEREVSISELENSLRITEEMLEETRSNLRRTETDLAELRLIGEASVTKSENTSLTNAELEDSSKEAEEDVESYKERIRELEAKLNDKNKALKLRQQQLQDLRKTLAKEMKTNNVSSTQIANQLQPLALEGNELFPKSSSQTSLVSLGGIGERGFNIRVEEMSSQTDMEPAIVPSVNSNHYNPSSSSQSYAEDVNFQYMKSVMFKFITTSDPQVTHHLTKVVSTLLHLNNDEARILEKSTDKRVLNWLGNRGEHPGY